MKGIWNAIHKPISWGIKWTTIRLLCQHVPDDGRVARKVMDQQYQVASPLPPRAQYTRSGVEEESGSLPVDLFTLVGCAVRGLVGVEERGSIRHFQLKIDAELN